MFHLRFLCCLGYVGSKRARRQQHRRLNEINFEGDVAALAEELLKHRPVKMFNVTRLRYLVLRKSHSTLALDYGWNNGIVKAEIRGFLPAFCGEHFDFAVGPDEGGSDQKLVDDGSNLLLVAQVER